MFGHGIRGGEDTRGVCGDGTVIDDPIYQLTRVEFDCSAGLWY